MMKKLLILPLLLMLASCAELPPKNADNLCATFKEKMQWYDDAKNSSQRWGVSIPILMAIMHQESHFVADAKPPRTWLLGFIPWFRPSSAFGYAQAIDGTWDNYLDSAGSFGADRDDFADAIDFIGWYSHSSHTQLGIPIQDVKNLYLAYYEGLDGYARKSYLKKADVQKTAAKVAYRARLFQNQLSQCQIN
ncbi:MAG: hypothetical protein CG439_997 [Methylococcaceae bacterium NSP1-2]|nr:hypothetical protein [Methylococcaceae bacterium]OYV19155.1 MAG: hypothetical protein CG439_997 [Methylococcaceae bacterium NSP1-2]